MKSRRTTVMLIVGVGLLAAIYLIYAGVAASRSEPDSRVAVTASFYPLAEFSRQIGGSHVRVVTLVKPGVEPHDYDPTPQDIADVYKSKVFVYNGADLERWAEKLRPDATKSGVIVVPASNRIGLKKADASEGGPAGATDPHIWMDPVLAAEEVKNIEGGLIQADPTHRSSYEANAANYIAQLQRLDDDFRKGLRVCQTHTIITSHQAFSYLGAEYGVQAIGIAGLSPDDEPSPQKLAQVAQAAKQYNVHYIFFEDLASPKLSQTIARETGAKTIAFNPLEGLTPSQQQHGANYISIQKANLQALRTALNCK